MVELGHAPPAAKHGKHHVDHGFLAEAITLGQIVDDPEALGGQLIHGDNKQNQPPYPQ
jgi:hypothetical protein